MSLKAKMEAVIYASEEPVTLAQLVSLLGHEGQTELDRLEDRQGSLGLETDAPVASDALVESADLDEAEAASAPDEAAGAAEAAAEPELTAEPGPEQSAATEATPPVDAAEKRLARERERRLREFFREILEELMRDFATGDRGIEVREVAGGFRMATKPEYHDAVRGFVRSLKPVLKLSLQALETLAVVAYKQPVTAPEVSEIRGVDSGGVLGSLLGRKLISTAGRKAVVGRPILYKTTKDFLLRFGLKDLSELPSIEEFEKLAGDFVEQEEIPMPSGSETLNERVVEENLQAERDAIGPQADGDSDDLNDGSDASNRPSDEMPAVDGRLSGVNPSYESPGDDPSADEAAIQQDEQQNEEE